MFLAVSAAALWPVGLFNAYIGFNSSNVPTIKRQGLGIGKTEATLLQVRSCTPSLLGPCVAVHDSCLRLQM